MEKHLAFQESVKRVNCILRVVVGQIELGEKMPEFVTVFHAAVLMTAWQFEAVPLDARSFSLQH